LSLSAVVTQPSEVTCQFSGTAATSGTGIQLAGTFSCTFITPGLPSPALTGTWTAVR
jgi:hypothetical protein